jgi:hypothetical protein
MDLGALLSHLGDLVKSSESVAAANLLESTANAFPANLADPVQQGAFALAFNAAIAKFIADQAASLPALGANASASIKQFLLTAATSLRAQATTKT